MNLSKSKHQSILTITKFWCLILVFSIVSTQSISQVKSPKLNKKSIEKSMAVATRNDKLVIYQIMTHIWANTNTTNKQNGSIEENGITKFSDYNDLALSTLKKLGYSHLYMTGILEHATTLDYTSIGIKKDHPENVKGRCGAPFAVKDYYDTNPFYANDPKNRMKELKAMIERIHKAGLKLVIDCIPNHLAREYGSDMKPKGIKDFGETDDKSKAFDPQNNFYYLPNKTYIAPKGGNDEIVSEKPYFEYPAKVTGNDVFSEKPSVNDWFETVKLNYGVDYQHHRAKHFNPIPSTWLKMTEMLSYWTKLGVDGFRCDMAEMVPYEFWNYAITKTKKLNPKCVFIAEIYNPAEYHNYIKKGKFDYLYDKIGMYDALRRLIENQPNATVEDITKLWQHESGDIAEHMLRFLENHDEQRIASRFFATDPFKAMPAMVVSATLNRGPLMIYFGQEVGEPAAGSEGFGSDDGRTTMFDFWGVPEHQKWLNNGKFDGGQLSDNQKKLYGFYQDLIKLVNDYPAIQKGHFFDLQYAQNEKYDKKKVYSYLRHLNGQNLLFVCNFDQDHAKSFHLNLIIPKHALELMNLKGKAGYEFQEIFQDKRKLVGKAEEGLNIEMKANSVLIFEIK